MKTVEFAKPHNYGGQPYAAGDTLTLPEDRAAMLKAAGVLREDKPKAKKAKDD